MTPDLYEVLDVSNTATAADVTRAWRRAARESHPDTAVPGAKPFHLVRLAYDVLSDPDRRAHYDRTGEAEPAQPDNARAAVASVLSLALEAILNGAAKAGKNPLREDLVKAMRWTINQMHGNLKKRLGELLTEKRQLLALQGRFVVTSGDNLLDQIVAAKVTEKAQLIADAERESAAIEQALEVLDLSQFWQDAGPVWTWEEVR